MTRIETRWRFVADWILDSAAMDAWGEHESTLDSLLAPYGLEFSGAGSGFGMRDVEYDSSGPLDAAALDSIRAALRAHAPWLNSARYVTDWTRDSDPDDYDSDSVDLLDSAD